MKNLWQVCVSIWWQWGDEWKWKLIDNLAQDFDIIVRSAGWANAGHTIYVDWQKVVTNLMPSWVLQWKTCIIWNWCVVHLPTLLDEIHGLDKVWVSSAKLLKISDRAQLVFDFHKEIDWLIEEQKWKQIWTTRKWIWPAYMFKILRNNLRVWDLFYDLDSFIEKLREQIKFVENTFWIKVDFDKELRICEDLIDSFEWMVCDTSEFLINAKKDWKRIILEWAQWALLDIDHWTYPFVTSSNTVSAWALAGSWMAPNSVDSIVAIVKAYTTRVWNWPFPTELSDVESEALREKWWEFWAVTWRPRRCGWLDLVSLKRTCEISWITDINLTKLDILSWISEIKVWISYKLNWKEIFSIPMIESQIEKIEVEFKTFEGWEEDISLVKNFDELPENAKNYVKFIEDFLWVPIPFIWVWVDRNDIIFR